MSRLKEGAGGEQLHNSISYSEVKGVVRALTTPTRSRDDYHLMTREQQSVQGLVTQSSGGHQITAVFTVSQPAKALRFCIHVQAVHACRL